jgi:CTP-dependent riboflavin kinase
LSKESDKKIVLSGIIVSGAGQAAYFTGLDWVQEQCAEKLYFQPYPGTLNIQVDEDCLALLTDLQKKPALNLLSPNPSFCNARTLPASLSNLAVAIIIPAESVNIHGPNILEVIAPVNLKKTLSLQDGDRILLTVEES